MKSRISTCCLLGFIFSCIGVIAIPLLQILGEGMGVRVIVRNGVQLLVCAVITEAVALILSIAGVVTASIKHLKLRGLGIAGIAISAVFLFIVFSVFLRYAFGMHESPPTSTTRALD